MPSPRAPNIFHLLRSFHGGRKKTVFLSLFLLILASVICLFTFVEHQYYPIFQDIKNNLETLISGARLSSQFIDPRLPEELLEDSEKNHDSLCVHPDLQLWPPDVTQSFYMFDKLTCDSAEDWVYIHNSTLFISEEVHHKYGDVSCKYRPILRVKEWESKLGTTIPLKNHTSLASDFVEVDCESKSTGKGYHNLHAGIVPVKAPRQVRRTDSLNVVILGIDSLSRLGWMRNMPKVYTYLTQTLQATVLKKYNIVDDGTVRSLVALLTGHYLEELPEARRSYPGATTVDSFPFMWQNWSRAGYVTHFSEDWPHFSVFYLLQQFQRQPVDHYFNTLLARLPKVLPPYCLGARPIHTAMLNHIQELFRVYPHRPKFSFNFFGRLSHNRLDGAQRMEDEILTWLRQFHQEGHLNNTLLVLMSDHGLRAGAFRLSHQGKYEERLPFLSMVLPPWFKHKYPKAMSNLKTNAHLLTTPFDIHATILHLLNRSGVDAVPFKYKRGVSLFSSIPRDRSCEEIGIPLHWCTCLRERHIPITNKDVSEISQHFVDHLNVHLGDHLDQCSPLRLEKVISAASLTANKNFQKFQYFRDGYEQHSWVRNGAAVERKTYQVVVQTVPGHAQFEASVYMTGRGEIQVDHFSRVNLYGDQSKCIAETLPHLKPICYCN